MHDINCVKFGSSRNAWLEHYFCCINRVQCLFFIYQIHRKTDHNLKHGTNCISFTVFHEFEMPSYRKEVAPSEEANSFI